MLTKRIIISGVILAAMLLAPVPLLANPIAPSWHLLNNSAPARYAHACASDLSRDVIVMFGGKDSLGQMPSETWELALSGNSSWNQFAVPGPEGRIGHGMCYDIADSVTLLFGGINQLGQFLNDTWEWNGQNWIKVDSTGPSPRGYFAFAYDYATRRAVLFGGIGNDDSLFGDTWEWDGSHWTQAASFNNPPPRFITNMSEYIIYPSTTRLILFGGEAGYESVVYNDTWMWADSSWYQMESPRNPPPPRVGHVMSSFSGLSGSMILFGGQSSYESDSTFGDMWEFVNEDGWFNLGDFYPMPSSRTQAAMVRGYVPQALSTADILIGGRDSTHIFSESWAYSYFDASNRYTVGDVNCSGIFTGLDVTYAVRYFKGGPPPPRWTQCFPHNDFYASGDVNASCSFDGLDVSFMVRYFKGGAAPIPCPDCPPGM
jgi:hypothetical protein